ncbi:apolipoprotein N-acyltransferase [Litorivivens lipolytica]|uniref:Apolipoprotein N-acyltransferase n=1 Tax=Litorivivens lipolytica TaxID=1524264 RepID=A0A7W4W4W0_9GAMM|nr:apolipoprotein N-acyltransferase [Litorivivens lipolytica]MBB3046949.1 apolipoprotein N-acyltransferase [Litorivivens lipolytica]
MSLKNASLTTLSLIAMVLCGVAVTLSFAPFGLWPLSLLAAAVLNLALEKSTPRRALALGWAYGAGLFGSGVSWIYVSIHDYGFTSAPLAIAFTAIFCLFLGGIPALVAWAYCRWLRDGRGGRVLGFAAIWLLSEWIRVWLLTGFPWLYLGYAYIDTPLAGWAPIGGVFLLSLMVYFCGACLAQALLYRRYALLLAAVALWGLGYSLQSVEWTEANGRELKIAAVQANITQDQKWLPENYEPTLKLYDELTQPLLGQHDVVIWPEAAIPNYYHIAKDYLDMMAEMAEQSDTALVTGIPLRTPEGVYNALAVLTGGSGVYAKQRLVPFGEYVPLEDWLRGLIRFFNLPMSSFTEGPAEQKPLMIKEHTVAPYICYEVVYPDFLVNQMNDAELLLTVSNDAWFGRSIGPKQHFQMARMRALETGRELIRATGTGTTAIIDARGKVRERIAPFERSVLSTTVKGRHGSTPFMQLGSWPVWLLCFALVAIAAFTRPDNRRL